MQYMRPLIDIWNHHHFGIDGAFTVYHYESDPEIYHLTANPFDVPIILNDHGYTSLYAIRVKYKDLNNSSAKN